MITFEWSFPSFDVIKSEDGLTDVVKNINWIYWAKDGEYSSNVYGQVTLSSPDPANFIPYSEITKEWAITRVSASVDVASLEAILTANIDNQKNPPIVPMAPPF